MWNEDDRKWLYDKMQKAGVETGTYDEFTSSMDNDEDRDWYYQKAKGMNLDLGSADDFRAMMATPKGSQPAAAQAANTPAQDTAQTVMTQQPVQEVTSQQMQEQQPSKVQQPMNTSQLDPKYQLNEDGSVKPWNMLETERTLDEQGNTVNKPKLVKGADGTDVYRNAMTGEEYNPLSPEGMEMAGQNTSIVPTDLKKANREQVANLSADIDNAFAEYNKNNVSALSLGTYYGGAAGMNATNDKEWQTLSAAKHSMDDAKKMIEAADANAKNGTLGEWLNGSFAGGAARGFGEKLFDVRTWDMGLTDATENKALYDALQKADNGKELTKSEQMLLDAKAVELATNAYFGSYVGRGYKAGEVTAESLPFMLEMCINPASAAGETAQSMLARYAMKRLGNKAVAKAVGMAGRAAADLGASAVMSATSGSGRVAADTFDRMNGTVQYDTDENGQSIFAGHTDGEDFATALGKAFGSTTIENYSEMVGEYFAPVLGFARKGATEGLEKIGLGKVNDFIEQVGASDLAKMVTDFEKNAKWSGLFSEYAEEVTGNIMNALTVGDMTLDTAEGTGVFNLDQNIDTFLGTALMGGALSGIKTLGYRTPKYSARKAMTGADDKAAALFADPAEWGNIRNTIAFGTDEDAKEMLADVLGSDAFSAEQKAAVMNYASKAEAYKGVMMAEHKRRGENNGSAEVDVETSYDNGQSLETPQEKNDARNMYDMQRERLAGIVDEDFLQQFDEDPLEALNDVMTRDDFTEEERQAALDYVNAKATYDGMIDKVRDDIDSQVAASDASINSRTNRAGANAGMIVPATMKMGDRHVYVIDGDIQMMDDGSMVDVSKSSESILVRDAETGKLEFVSPHDVLNLGQAVSVEQEKATARDAIMQQVAQEQSAIIEGVLPFNAGDVYELADENGQTVKVTVVQDNGDGNVTVTMNGQNVPMPKDQVQSMSDAANMKRLADYQQQKNGGADNAPTADATGTVAGSQQREYALNDEVVLRDADGNDVRGTIVSEPDADGLYEVETAMPINGKRVNQWSADEIGAMLMEHNGEAVSQPAADATGMVEGVQNSSENVINGGENVQTEAMPMVGEGENAEPDFMAVTPERGFAYLFGESGLDESDAAAFLNNNVTASAKDVEKIKGKKPKMGTSIAKFNKDTADWQNKLNEAESKAEYWKQMKALRDGVVAEQKAEAKAQQDAAIDQARAEEAAYAKEQAQKAAEQAELGSNNVAPSIRDKWANAPKTEGVADEIVLANGEKVAGKYYLVESGAASASHDANNGFVKTEGFPVDENGNSVNDRDYERDQDAQRVTRQIADNYDSRALQTPVVVSQDGVVLSGNGRTMAGELAASNNTDGAYVDYLKNYGQRWGFTSEQVGGMQHPRVVFVPDAAMPYTAETFAKFNQQEMKGQNKTEQAVKLGKVVDDATFGRIITSINRFERMSDFYADAKAATEAIGELQKAGAISQAQVAEMYDGDGISAIGRELLENMLVGKAFENNPDAVREITAFRSVRQTVIKALGEILNNVKLGEDYSLEEELAGAIDLVYKARKEGGYKEGERVSGFARQMNLGFFGEDMTVADMNNVTMLEIADILNSGFETRLKVYMQNYNTHAQESAAGQLDLFSGEVMSKEDILNDVNNLFNNGTEQETADTRAEGVAEDGAVNNGGEGSNAAAQVNNQKQNGGIFEYFKGTLKELIRLGESATNELIKMVVVPNVSKRLKDDLAEKGVELKGDYRHTIDTFAVKHTLNEHADEAEVLRGQVPITPEDIELASDVIENYDEDGITIEENKRGLTNIIYKKTYPDGRVVYVEEVRGAKKGELAFVSMRKYKNKNSRLPNEAEEASTLGSSTVSERKDSNIIANNQAQVDETDIFSGNTAETESADGNSSPVATAIAAAEAETDTNPSEAQKEAGNYKKGHVKVDGYDITIENPKGSVRSGKDADGKEWSVTMNNTYGYIRGTEGVDGDHIDVFLSDNPEQGNVYVVDQVDADGNFDEHKVMYGFGSTEEARDNYLANYSEGWKMGTITEVSKEEFKKWIESSHRKTKPFSEYKSVKKEGAQGEEALDPRYTPGWDGDYAKWKKRQDYYDEIERKEKAAADEGRVAYYFSDTDSYGQRNGTFHKVWLKPENIQRDEYNNPRYKGLFLWTQQEAWHSEEGFQQGHIFYDEQELAKKGWVKDDEEKKPGKAAEAPLPRYVVTPTTYTTAKGKELQMQKLVINGLDKKQITAANKLAKERKGWWSREDAGFLMRSEEDAKWLADAVLGNEEAVEDAQPASLADVQKAAEVVEEKPSEKPAVKEFHGGEQVWSKRHNENKHILMAHRVTMADGATFVQSYNFTDGTSATALEVEDPHTEQKQEQKTEAEAGSGNKLVTDERYAELQARLKAKLNRLNVGIDPEVLAIGTEMAVYHIEKGTRKFAEYAKAMIEDIGDVVRPYLKAFYNGVRDMPEVEQWADELTPYDEVRRFDMAGFDKNSVDAMATAEMVVNEQNLEKQAEEVKNNIVETRNNERHETEKQIAASTEAVASEAETVASEAESVAESGDEAAINEQVSKIDEELEKVNAQLALLGYYEADTSDHSKFHESYGYMKTAEKKAVADADKLAKAIASSLGVELGRKKVAQANIAPAGGDIYFKIPLTESRELYVNIGLIPETNADTGYSDDLRYNAMMYRIEDPTQGGMSRYVSGNEWFYQSATLDDVTSGIKSLVKHYVREFEINPLETKATTEKTVKKVNEKGTAKKKAVPLQADTLMGDLFADLMDGEVVSTTTTINNNNNEQQLERDREGVRTEGLPANGNQQAEQTGRVRKEAGQASERADRGGEAGRTGGLGSELQSTRGLAGQLKKKTELTPLKPEERKNTNNNHAERGKDYAPKGVEARIDANIKAIEVMQELMENGQKATPDQMAVLRQYSGWGGLGKAFTDATMSKRLRELLGDEAYEQANMSRNSAYYTPAAVIDAMWDVAKAMGFQGGNVLEGSAGIGNIIGAMPMDMSDRSNIHAVEIDGTTGNILSLLYPDAQVEVQGFEATRVPNGSVDLAITNVPFVTGLHVMDTTGDKDLSKKFRDIHDFCIAKNIRKLRDGGIGIFISSSGTMDNSKKLRDWIVSDGNADVVGAFRLNNETFGGTGATSDIIVVRKRVNGVKSTNAIDVSTTTAERSTEYDTGETKKVKGQMQPVVKQLAMDYNRYFVEHPENMGGKMMFGFENNDTFRPTSRALYPERGKNQGELLNKWVKSFENMAEEPSATAQATVATDAVYEELGAGVKEGSMLLDKDGRICVAQFGKAVPMNLNDNKIKGKTKKQCFEAYSAIKDALADVLKYQTENDSDAGLKPLLAKLNKAFDDFVKNFGHLHKNNQIAWLKNDVDWSSIMALETTKDKVDSYGKVKQEYGKTDIFKQRVVEKDKAPEPKNVKDGIIASIYQYGRVNVPYIAEKLGKTEAEVRDEIIESGLGFENPVNMQLEVSYEYLSGNVREKLQQAMDANDGGKYDANVKALEKVVPMDIPAHLIDFTLGSSWVDHKLYEDYVKDRTDIDVTLTNAGGTWIMKTPYYVNNEKNRSAGVYSEMLRKTVFGHQLIEAAIQNKSITVSETHKKWDGTTETTTDKEATQACAARIDEIRQDFKDWARQKMQTDSEMSAKMERIYNDQFNNFVPVSVPEEFVPEYFGGASHKFKMRPHQAKAIVRGTMQPVLLAHEVGTGKTFTLISTAMEMRRLGTARKPMVVVQNATVGQFVASAKALYPNAKVLTLEEKDHTGEGRKNFYAKIKYNDWDMIVVPQSVFERIPDSEERQMAFIEDKIQEKLMALEAMREADPDSWVTKAAEREIEQLEAERAQVGSVAADKRKSKDEKKEAVTRQNAEVKAREMLDRATDDVENFDDMGIDAILVDEAHEYKHLGFATAMQRGVKGVDPSYSKKAQGVYLKAQAVLEKNNGRNVIFATGTPISNTAAEIWTFMRYLMPADTMKDYGIYYFDDFVRNFGNLQTMLEFTTSGKFKENNRFAGYVNLPELVRIWSSVSDTVLTREAGGVSDKIPDMETGKAQDIYLPQTRALRSVMKFVKAELNRYENMTGKEKKENSAIPLKMYGIAKAAAVDARLVLEDAEDDPNSKTNEAVRRTVAALKKTAKYNGTVALFADNYQNKHSGFNIYEDIREKLIKEGVPADQIVVMKSGMSVKKKLEIFDKVNLGDVRVIMGSTFTLGTGVNIQERLHTLIHLDAPNRPMDYTQRNGRILRQGNLHKEMGLPVSVLRFGVEDSLDVTAYQRLKTKGAIADSIMNGKQMMSNSMENRALEEEEDVFGDTVAQLSGSEYAMLKNQAEKDVRKYEAKRKQWEADQTYIHNAIPRLEEQIVTAQQQAADNRRYAKLIDDGFKGEQNPAITIGKQTFADLEAMGEYFKEYNKKLKEDETAMRESHMAEQRTRKAEVKVGNFTFDVKTTLKAEVKQEGVMLVTTVRRKTTYSCDELGLDDVAASGGYLKNAIEEILEMAQVGGARRLSAAERNDETVKRLKGELEQVKAREGKPFEYEKELEAAHEHYDEYSELMKKEMEEKEKKYAEMDSEVEAATNVDSADEAEEDSSDDTNVRMRERTEFTDGEILPISPERYGLEFSLADSTMPSYRSKEELLHAFQEKHPAYAAVLTADGNGIEVTAWKNVLDKNIRKPRRMNGEPTKVEKQRSAYVERKTRIAIDMVNAKAEKLGLNVEVKTDTEGLTGRRARAKGWYDTTTGKITIILPNHTDGTDVMRTLMHEGVAHHGLRQMFGKDFDTFLDNVYANASEEVRKRIAEMAARKGWDFHVATEEYLAALAEDIDFERKVDQTWWQKVKFFFIDMLRKAGIVLDDKLTDNDLRYIVWKSYERMAYADEYGAIRDARTEVMKQSLGVGNYAQTANNAETLGDVTKQVADGSELLYRDGDRMDQRDHAIVSGRYEREMQNSMYQFREAMQDSMLSLKKLMDYVAEATGEKVKDYENAYMAENALSSKNHAEQELYGKMLFNPMLDEVHRLAKEPGAAGSETEGRDGVTRYMMAKHGLERQKLMETRAYQAGEDSDRDFAGLTGLFETDDLADAIAQAEQLVADFESAHDVTELWARVNACTKSTLEKTYKSGLLSKEGYETISKMYEYYIPLRGFDATTSDQVYDYLTRERSSFNNPLKKAEGRSSVANDPLATIANMADSAIVQGNKNLMKQKFLKFVMNHPTDVASVNRMWLKKNDITDTWEAVTAQLDENDTPEEILQKTEAFEEQMEQLAQNDPDHYKRGKDASNIPFRTLGKDMDEHMVHVKMGGQNYIITINGNPRVAQALNGLTNPDNDSAGAIGAILKAGEYVNRQMSAFYTTRNPEFVLSNFLRDAIYSNSTMWVRETPNYALKFNKNFVKYNPKQIYQLLQKHNAGTLDMSVPVEKAFYDFMMNGGETGYTVVKDIEKQKKLIKKYMGGKDAKIPVGKAWDLLGEKLDEYNRAVENCARFAAFLTSREMGRTVERSVMDAKEVSVNFNKKGAGSKFLGKQGQGKWYSLGNVGAMTSGVGRSFYVFWNAAVQGTTNFGRLHKNHTAKALAMDAGLFLLGAVLAGMGSGDDDEYYNLPSYVRRSNICFKMPFFDSYITIPLGIEQRAIYGLGELFSSVASGRERLSGLEIAKEIAAAMSSLMPVDMMEGNGELSGSALVPSYVKPIVEASVNKDWKGMPIYKDTPWNKEDPEYTKASKRTNKMLVNMSEALNEWTGGDDVKKGWVDINPAQVEHVLEGTFGGVSTMLNKLVKIGQMATGQQDFDLRNVPMVSRVVKSTDTDAESRRINTEYYKYYNEYKETKRLVSHYEKQEDEGILGMAEKLDFMYNSPEYGRYEIVDDYYDQVKDLTDKLKETVEPDERQMLEEEITDLKREMIEAVRAFDDARNNR